MDDPDRASGNTLADESPCWHGVFRMHERKPLPRGAFRFLEERECELCGRTLHVLVAPRPGRSRPV